MTAQKLPTNVMHKFFTVHPTLAGHHQQKCCAAEVAEPN